MNCVFVVETECCMHNCSKVTDKEPIFPEYEAGCSESEEEEEDMESMSGKTVLN